MDFLLDLLEILLPVVGDDESRETPLSVDREPADEQPAAHLPIRNAPESPGNAPHSEGPSPCNRSNASKKTGSSRVTATTVKAKKLLRKQSTVRSAGSLPNVEIPQKPPLTSHMIQQATVSKIWSVLKRLDACPLIQFLSQVGNCYDFHTTPWVAIPGAQVRTCCYMAPVPEDVPHFARRLLNVPDQLSSTSVWRLVQGPEEMRFVQHSSTSDVLYGDRFKVQCTVRFREQAQGVVVDQWCDIVWDMPLPWTHVVVRHFIEHRALHDALAMGGDLVRCIEDALETQESMASVHLMEDDAKGANVAFEESNEILQPIKACEQSETEFKEVDNHLPGVVDDALRIEMDEQGLNCGDETDELKAACVAPPEEAESQPPQDSVSSFSNLLQDWVDGFNEFLKCCSMRDK